MNTTISFRKAGLIFSALAVSALLALPNMAYSADKSPIATFNDYKDAWNKHDANLLAASFEEGGTFFSPAAGQPLSGPATAGFVQGLFAAIPDLHVDVQSIDQFGEGKLVERWVVKGTWSQPFPAGPLAGKPATGKSFVLPGVSIFEIRNMQGVRYVREAQRKRIVRAKKQEKSGPSRSSSQGR